MKRTTRIKIIGALVVLMSMVFGIAAVAWFALPKNAKVDKLSGSILSNYFHCGNGSESNPFVITRPIHYYNLVNLYQRVDRFANEPYFFQLGYDLDEDGETLEFYTYDDNGNQITTSGSEYTQSLNLACYSEDKFGALLPIGTSEKPFVGSFDGSGLTVSNLTVKCTETVNGETYKTCDVGIFGVVSEPLDAEGNLIPSGYIDDDGNFVPDLDEEGNPMYLSAKIANVYYDNVTIDLTGADESATCKTNTTVHMVNNDTEQDTVYVGIIAGHIKMSTQVFDVYLNHTKLAGGHAAESNFGYFGCVEQTDGMLVNSIGTLVADLRAKGDEAGFGGSIDMAKMYNRVSQARTYARNKGTPRYVSGETVIIDEVLGTVTTTTTNYGTNDNYRWYQVTMPVTGNNGVLDPASGAYFFYNRTDTDQYTYISGLSDKLTKTVTTYTYKNEFVDAFYIHNGSKYLCVNDGAISDNRITGTSSDTWAFDGNYVYTIYDGTKYYLAANTNTRAVSVTTNRANATQWAKNETTHELTTTSGGITWYLYDDGGWKIDFAKDTYTINDGVHYLVAATSGMSSANSAADATKWGYDGQDLYTVIGATKYYLSCTDTMALSTTRPSVKLSYVHGTDDVITYSYNGATYYLYHDGNSWWVTDKLSQITISKGTAYLRVDDTNTVVSGTRGTATKFIFDETNGLLYTVVNGKIVYLYGDTELKTTTTKNTATATKWQYSAADNQFSYVRNGTTYYLVYSNNKWVVSDGTGKIAFKSGTYYLNVTNGTLQASTTPTYWDFNGTTGTISYTDGTTTYYLRGVLNGGRNVEVTTTAGNATQWTFNNNELTCSLTVNRTATTFNLILDTTSNVWRVENKDQTYYEIKSNSGAHYLSMSNATVTDRTTTADATWWMLSDPAGNTTASTYTNNNLYYLRLSNNTIASTNTATLYWNGNRFRNSNNNSSYYLRCNNGTWSRSNQTNPTSNQYLITKIAQTFSSTVNMETTTIDTTVTRTETTADPESYIEPGDTHNIYFDTARMQIVEKNVETGVPSGLVSYFPLRTEGTTGDDLFKVSDKNTGYIISGGYVPTRDSEYSADIRISRYAISGNIATTSFNTNNVSYTRLYTGNNYLCINEDCDGVINGTNGDEATWWEFSNVGTAPSGKISTEVKGKTYYLTNSNGTLTVTDNEAQASTWSNNNNNRLYAGTNNYIRYNNGDWTIGNYTALTFDKGAFGNIYTVDANSTSGHHVLTNAQKTDVYDNASKNFLQTINGQTNVYGLHFMNSEISMDKIITVDEANILGTVYENYQLPEDCIDFTVVEKGTISFFAGTYFSGNNAFFSLHEIIRDKDTKEITDIKEIETVYRSTVDAKKPYLYKYKNEALVYPEGESASDYEVAFQTSWITNPPSGVSSNNKYMYYFEIPCNSGEYALGSVEGKTGAYLIYLDIATNGGAAITSIVDEDQTNPIISFRVDYRDAPDRLGDDENTVYICAEGVPADATKDNFSVEISFSNSEGDVGAEYPDGIYTIHITNKTGSDINFYSYLCDNDGNVSTPFGYAFRIYYSNGDHEEELLPHLSLDFWKSIAGFVVPASGEAREMTTMEYQEYASEAAS